MKKVKYYVFLSEVFYPGVGFDDFVGIHAFTPGRQPIIDFVKTLVRDDNFQNQYVQFVDVKTLKIVCMATIDRNPVFTEEIEYVWMDDETNH